MSRMSFHITHSPSVTIACRGKGEYGSMLIAVAISKSSREVLLLAMSFTATEFQRVLDVIKVWRNEGFEALKIDGQYALCDRDPVTDYVAKYCCKTEIQERGLAHAHRLVFVDEVSLIGRDTMRNLYVRLSRVQPARL